MLQLEEGGLVLRNLDFSNIVHQNRSSMGKAYFCKVQAPEASVPEKCGVIAICVVCKSTVWQNLDY